jgi:hypothetical protein
MMRKYFQDYES